jgi:hypothetical protein
VRGETLPHDEALHETVHVTPLPDESLLTVAVKLACPPARTELTSAVTETVIGMVVGIAGELPPPQSTMLITEEITKSRRTKDAMDFIYASKNSLGN